MNEYTPRHYDPFPPEGAEPELDKTATAQEQPKYEHFHRAIEARRHCADLPLVDPGEAEALVEQYRGTYENVREAITGTLGGHNWQEALNNLSYDLGVLNAFRIDWDGIEEGFCECYDVIEDGDLIHVFDPRTPAATTHPGDGRTRPAPERDGEQR
jgi:hypothetical protein